MQPYFLPYIGYFQLINAVDAFVFYDDVNYIKNGWINRNRILVNKHANYITIPLEKASSFKLINEINIIKNKEFLKALKTIELAYKKAPYFEPIFQLISQIWKDTNNTISDLAVNTCKVICQYLKLETKFYSSSLDFSETKGMERAERLQAICKKLGASEYINTIGGTELYTKEEFKNKGINLNFIKSKDIKYPQYGNEFIPWLSILDVLMFNSPKEINIMLNQFELV